MITTLKGSPTIISTGVDSSAEHNPDSPTLATEPQIYDWKSIDGLKIPPSVFLTGIDDLLKWLRQWAWNYGD